MPDNVARLRAAASIVETDGDMPGIAVDLREAAGELETLQEAVLQYGRHGYNKQLFILAGRIKEARGG